jgi:hypothetical protein
MHRDDLELCFFCNFAISTKKIKKFADHLNLRLVISFEQDFEKKNSDTIEISIGLKSFKF